MSSQQSKLGEFGAANRTGSPDSDQDAQNHSNTSKEVSDDNTEDVTQNSSPSDHSQHNQMQCPHYNKARKKCKKKLDEDLIDFLNVLKIDCGYGISYITDNVNAKITRKTAEGYASALRLYTEFLHERGILVTDATLHDIDNYMGDLAARNRTEGTLGHHLSAVTNLYKHISVYLNENCTVDWVEIRELIDPSDYNTSEGRERDYLEKSEVKQLYDALGSLRDKLMVQVGVELGPRSGDLRSIKLDAVDFEKNKIHLTNTKAGGSYDVPITEGLKLQLRRWIEIERSSMPISDDNPFLFPSNDDGMMKKARFCDIVKQAAEEAGIQETTKSDVKLTEREKQAFGTQKDYKEYHRVTPHTLRHTFYHLLSEAGIPKEARSEAMDHDSMEVTDEFYDHEESNYAELMDRLFSGT